MKHSHGSGPPGGNIRTERYLMNGPQEHLDSDRHVLAVDDDPAVLHSIRRELELAGYVVTACDSAEVALDQVRVQEFGLIVSDNIMPGMRGLEFLSIVMETQPDARRILVTGYTDQDQAIEAFNHGVLHRYVAKPWKRDAFRNLLNEQWGEYTRSRKEHSALEDIENALRMRGHLVDEAERLIRHVRLGEAAEAMPDAVQHKHTVVLQGDVVGFSRMMGEDHEFTLAALTECRGLLSHIVSTHHGRMVNFVGDSVLAEFMDAVDAVNGTVALQRALMERNAPYPAPRRMAFRFGINEGDVLVRGGDLYGTTVNVAARIQVLADPGGICVTELVRSDVLKRVSVSFEPMGERVLKNIAEPVRVFRIAMD